MNDGRNIYDKTFDERESDDTSSDAAIAGFVLNLFKFLIALVFLPAAIYGAIFYFVMLRRLKQRFSVSLVVSIISWLICWGVWSLDSVGDTFIYTMKNISEISSNWREALPGLIVIQVALGTLFGLIIVGMSIYQMKSNPHRLKIQGNWMYRFQFNRTPWGLFFRRARIKALKNGELTDEEKSPLGLDENNKRDGVAYRYLEESVQHTIITGAAGSGKTVTELSLMLSDIKVGRSFVVIDFKKSPEFASKLAAWCHEYDRNFYHFVNGKPENYDVQYSLGQCTYDPLAGSSPTARADMLLGMREYDQASEVYKNYMVQLLQVLFNALDQADRRKYKESRREALLDAKDKSSSSNKVPRIIWDQGGIHQVASAIQSKITLDGLADACIGKPIEDDIREVAESYGSKNGLGNALNELRGQMRTITASEYGAWMKTEGDGRSIDLTKLMMDDGNVVLFSINSDTEPAFAKNVGTLLFSDLNSVSTNLRESGSREVRSIYVDEFQAVHPTTVKSLLEKARESRLAVILAQQSLDQIASSVQSNGESYLNAILDTCSNFIVHAGSTESSAERLSKIIGKEWVTKYTQSNSNESFIFSLNFWNKRKQIVQTSEVELPIAPTRLFMDLSMPNPKNGFRSTAVFVNKASFDPLFKGQSGGKAREIWMIPDDKVIAKYFVPKMSSENVYTMNDRQEMMSDSLDEDTVEETVPNEDDYDHYEEEPRSERPSSRKTSQTFRNSRRSSQSSGKRKPAPKRRIQEDLEEDSGDFVFEEIPENEMDEDMGMELFEQVPPEESEEDELVKQLLAEREIQRRNARKVAQRSSSTSSTPRRRPSSGRGLPRNGQR